MQTELKRYPSDIGCAIENALCQRLSLADKGAEKQTRHSEGQSLSGPTS